MVDILKAKGLECTGCEACRNACPADAIEMRENAWGFREAHIAAQRCIHCGRCEQVCPVLHEKAELKKELNTAEPACIAVAAEDELRYKSSSGGAFSVLAAEVLARSGVVYGAEMTEELEVRHTGVQTLEELSRLQKSKYVQSHIGLAYRQIREKLAAGTPVLFSGTPCQVAGLYGYLGGDDDNLYTVDILCHGVPSQKMLRESLAETDENHSLAGVDFRDKDYGWESLAMTLHYKNGEKRRLSYNESRYEQGFHPCMTLRESCYNCKFCAYPRVGDLSIGDFWRLEETHPELVDGKGTSALLLNSEKGKALFERVRGNFVTAQQLPLELLRHNRVEAKVAQDAGRPYFLELYPGHSFNRAVYLAQQGMFDVGLVGNWSYPNYGSELTYYALYTVLKNQGLSVGLVSWPETSAWKPYPHAQLFMEEPYRPHEILSIPATREDLFALGKRCDTYVLGSDQLLNNNLYQWFSKFVQLDWVPSTRKKIAYAASFGCDYIWGSDLDHGEMQHFLSQFDAFSLREQSGVELLKREYHVASRAVLDPVFLTGDALYAAMAEKGKGCLPDHPYLFAYILDPTPEKAAALRCCSEQLGLEPYSVSDAAPDEHRLEKQWDIETTYGIKLEEWVACIRGCEYMITDSFHGMCLAILAGKPFLAISNAARGAARFEEILGRLDLKERLLISETELVQRVELLHKPIDYVAVNKILDVARAESLGWLQQALAAKKRAPLTTYDLVQPQVNELAKGVRENENANRKQWGQLEDHAARLAGLEKLQRETAEADTKQWSLIEDHTLRMDGSDATLRELRQTADELRRLLEQQNRRLEEQNQRLEEQKGQLEEQKGQLDEQQRLLDEWSDYRANSVGYGLWKKFHGKSE